MAYISSILLSLWSVKLRTISVFGVIACPLPSAQKTVRLRDLFGFSRPVSVVYSIAAGIVI